MLFIRSFAFNIIFYTSLFVQILFWLPIFFFLPRRFAWIAPKFWALSSLWFHDIIIGTRYEITGLENLPKGPYILAAKHQSFWDILVLLPYIEDPLFVLKKQLFRIPLFGLYMMKMRLIPVDRTKGIKALKNIVSKAKLELGLVPRQLIIYPEGTRRLPGEPFVCKSGIAALYTELQLPVIPVVHESGLFWPRRKFVHFPGKMRVRFLPPIKIGLSKHNFMRKLVEDIEKASDEILCATLKDCVKPPFPELVKQRVKTSIELSIERKN